jgi:hypothetical protein
MRLAFAVLAAVVVSPAEANWTFCVAESGQDIWITDVFAAAHKREWLEADFTVLLRTRGVTRPVAQCPAPQSDKMDVFNAQLTAAEFHRKLGQSLHTFEMPAAGR